MNKQKLIDTIIMKIERYDRKNIIIIFFMIFFLMIIIKLFTYTVFNFNFYKKLADNQQIWKVIVPVNRWTLYSKTDNPTIIWTSLNLYDLAVDPKNIWNKQKLVDFITDIVFKELCEWKKGNDCYDNTLKFLRVIEIQDFSNEEEYVKKLFKEKLITRINQEKVTSVFVDFELNENQISAIKKSWILWLYIINSHLYINPEEIWNKENAIEFLNKTTSIENDELATYVEKKDLRYIPIINKISITTSEEIKKYLDDEQIAIKKWLLDEEESIWNFMILTPMPNRYYPEKEVASQVIWFVDGSWVWQYWLEWYFDDILKWNNWKIVSRKDIKWRIIDPITLNQEDIIWEWVKVYTTIDRNIQSKAEEIIEKWVKEYRANKWTIVIMDPKTWRVLTMANYPTYDLNNYWDIYELEKVKYWKYPNPSIDLLWYPVFVEDSEKWTKFVYDSKEIFLREATREELWDFALVKYKFKNDYWPLVYRNDAIASLYEPWSIMKAITVATWIDTWEINRYDMYMDNWEVKVWDFTIKNASKSCLWYNSFAHALNFSCNVWMIRIVQKIWKVVFHQYLTDFWFSEKTWITLIWEAYAQIKPRERWSISQLLTNSYWLWISVTPLQMATAYSVLANWWFYVKPRIVDSIVYPNWRIVEYKNEILKRVIKKSTSDTLTSMLNESITKWAANWWNVEWYALAWKTWTAQIPYKWGYEDWQWSTIASFVWYWPIQDPKFVVLVKLERPRSTVYWASSSAVLFKQMSEYLLDYYWIPKTIWLPTWK